MSSRQSFLFAITALHSFAKTHTQTPTHHKVSTQMLNTPNTHTPPSAASKETLLVLWAQSKRLQSAFSATKAFKIIKHTSKIAKWQNGKKQKSKIFIINEYE
ncbi:unnamed protein product [Ceratitis capitata]|uniref:(Mediterranean fruit fly) hypothetical protein n=1 Tax=Ceratitis capitata TaxID=7213 RepID=A0A811U7V2_CERCA|nr:unnamed protein product [Ceratitis capitata]